MGEALIDIIVSPQGEIDSVVGGGPVNTARTIARLGTEVSFLGGISQMLWVSELVVYWSLTMLIVQLSSIALPQPRWPSPLWMKAVRRPINF